MGNVTLLLVYRNNLEDHQRPNQLIKNRNGVCRAVPGKVCALISSQRHFWEKLQPKTAINSIKVGPPPCSQDPLPICLFSKLSNCLACKTQMASCYVYRKY